MSSIALIDAFFAVNFFIIQTRRDSDLLSNNSRADVENKLNFQEHFLAGNWV